MVLLQMRLTKHHQSKGDFVMSDAFEIGVTGSSNTTSTGIATSYQGLVDNINERISGVQAKLDDNTITFLSNTTGNETATGCCRNWSN